MPVPPEIAAKLAAKVASMTLPQRSERAAELVDLSSPRDEDDLEFVKLICGPDSAAGDLIKALMLGRKSLEHP